MIASLDFGDLNITSQEDDILDEDEALAGRQTSAYSQDNLNPPPPFTLTISSAAYLFILIANSDLSRSCLFFSGHIQANLEDELVQEALRKGLDLRQYSREIETELRKVELRSIEDCIPHSYIQIMPVYSPMPHPLVSCTRPLPP